MWFAAWMHSVEGWCHREVFKLCTACQMIPQAPGLQGGLHRWELAVGGLREEEVSLGVQSEPGRDLGLQQDDGCEPGPQHYASHCNLEFPLLQVVLLGMKCSQLQSLSNPCA